MAVATMVTMTHPSVADSAMVTQEAFELIWQPKGWVLVTPGEHTYIPSLMLWVGAWSSTEVYAAGDVVSYGGDGYIAKRVSQNVTPPSDSSSWDLVTTGTGTVPTTPDATATLKGKIQLTGDLGGTAASPTVPGLAQRIPLTQRGAANGVATLGSDSKIPSAQLPPLTVGDAFVVASQAAMLALVATPGDVAVRTDLDPDQTFMLTATPATTLANWVPITPPGTVISVNGRVGTVSGLAEDTAVVHTTGDESIDGIKSFVKAPRVGTAPSIRVVRTTLTPRQFGAAMNGTTDDSAAVQAMFDAPGDYTTGFHGTEMVIDGPCLISSSVILRRKSPRLSMPGWGSSTSNPKGPYLKWGGAAGQPMLVIREMWGGELDGLRFIGNSAAKPSAAIYLEMVSGLNSNTFSAFRRIWIGALYGYDTDDARQFVNGILLDGDINANNDLMLWQLINVHKADVGIKFAKSQMGFHWLQNFTTEECGVGIDSAADIGGANIHCLSSSEFDLRLGNGVSMNLAQFVSEGSTSMADLSSIDGPKSLIVRGGYWQATTGKIRSDGEFIRGQHLYPLEVALEDFSLTLNGTYTGPTPKVILKSPAGQASKKYLRLVNPSGVAAANIDMTTQIAGDVRVVRIERSATDGTDFLATQNIYGYPDNLDEKRFDMIQTNMRLVDDQAAATIAAKNRISMERGPTVGAAVNAEVGRWDFYTGPSKHNIGRIAGLVGPDWTDSGNIVLYTKESGASLVEMMRLHNTAASDQTGFSVMTNNGGSSSVRRVLVGPADSAGTGFRYLRVAN